MPLKHIDIRVRASHYKFVNENGYYYTESGVKKGLSSWSTPFGKPQLVNHDKSRDPVGRITAARTQIATDKISKDEPDNYIELDIRVSDQDAIQKVLDNRYYTGSVSAKAGKIECSECGQIINREGLCEHRLNSYNEDGEKIFWLIDEIEYIENSFVNQPADPYAVIDSIKIDGKWINYKEFLDNKDTYLKDHLEDEMKEKEKKLPASAFCGPNKTFPVADKEDIQKQLQILDEAKLSDSVTKKIKSSIMRKGKRFDVKPTEDQLKEFPDILTHSINVSFTNDEEKEVMEYLEKLNKVEDKVDVEQPDVTVSDNKEVTVESLKDELTKAKADHKAALEAKDTEIKALTDKLQENETILDEKESTINKLIDELAITELNYKNALIDNIIDVKPGDKDAIKEKLQKRTIESLRDSLTDMRDLSSVNVEDRVEDPTVGERKDDKPNEKVVKEVKSIEDLFSCEIEEIDIGG